MTTIEFIAHTRSAFETAANPADASAMEAYMLHHFPFFGCKQPLRKVTQRLILEDLSTPLTPSQTVDYAAALWGEPERELQYFAIELLELQLKKMPASALTFIEELIVTKSWWDTVDALASKLIGGLLLRFPHLLPDANVRYVTSDHLWLNRTALLFQLKYKTLTDASLLFANILQHHTSQEFFIKKAIGWALREYSKTAPQTVIDFIDVTPLQPLSRKEALKWLERNDSYQP